MPTKLISRTAVAALVALACTGARAQIRLHSETINIGPPPGPDPLPCRWVPWYYSNARAAGDVDDDGYDDVLLHSGTDYYLEGPYCWDWYDPNQPLRVVSGFDSSTLLQVTASTRREVAGVGDVDGDGQDDIAYAPPSEDRILVHSARLGVIRTILSPGGYSDRFGQSIDGLGDVDGDGFDDFLASSRHATLSFPGRTDLFSGCDGSVLRSFVGHSGRNAGDVDADGTCDVVCFETSVTVYSGRTGALIWNLPGTLRGKPAGDFDGDGWDDVISESYGLCVVYSGRTGAILQQAPPGECSPAGDVDGDGRDDIWFGNVLASSTGAAVSVPGGSGWYIGDFNRDGHDDWAQGAGSMTVNTGLLLPGAARRWNHGAACPGAGTSLPHIGLDRPPRYGSTLRFTLGGARPNATSVFHLGLPNRISLAVLGVPDCTLLVEPFFVTGQPTDAIGAAQFSFTLSPSVLPPDVELSAQWIGLDPGGNALGIEMSDTVRFIVGN